ncbi:hypothetical protein [Aeromonas phage phiWae14]|nr:hypothetical protein [Aeromonas phage phiWae14]
MESDTGLARLAKSLERNARRRQRRYGTIQPQMSMDAMSKLLEAARKRPVNLRSEMTC